MFWDGRRLVAGDGDGQVFQRMTSSEEMIAAQLSAGIISNETPFQYMGQTGALVQSLGAVFGVLVKQYRLGQNANEADWTLGAEALVPGSGTALYSLASPGTAYTNTQLGTDPQPAHMSGYVETDTDNGGIHINSGIPSRAFYCVATALGGPAWERAGRIWYAAMREPGLRPTSGFRRFARATVEAAEQLYGAEDAAVDAVRAGWEQVGVKPSQARARPAATQ
jgi:Zn-dependent metalloprotease